jgi:NAD(P)-dependent dehydrogenase (short-subunit alcohol dehydrogenase family)
MSFNIDLEGRRALVTGAGQGVGLGIARALGEAGAVVVVNDIRAPQAESAVHELRAAGGRAEALPFDVADYEQVSTAIKDADIEILVNNAGNAGLDGSMIPSDFVASNPADWRHFFDVNLFGVMHCTHAALPSMIDASWGRIITIVSDAGRYGTSKVAPYAAAKSGAAGFCRSIAREMGRYMITANCVSLSTIETPTTARPAPATPEEDAARQARLKPYVIRRRGTPEDVAGVVTFLASSRASWITGQTYAVNGGFHFSL